MCIEVKCCKWSLEVGRPASRMWSNAAYMKRATPWPLKGLNTPTEYTSAISRPKSVGG